MSSVSKPFSHFVSTKHYSDFPCSHRQHLHDGHCAFVHGYSRSFFFTFTCHELDKNGFVVDFGALKWVKEYLEQKFDHTLLLNKEDPLLPDFKALEAQGACRIVILNYGVGMEGTARHVLEAVDAELLRLSDGNQRVLTVECRENSKNSAIYYNPYLYPNDDSSKGMVELGCV